jgi:hypothetical protein
MIDEEARLPDAVRDFVLRTLDSVAELEALLLARAHRDQSWTVPELAQRLYITEAAAAGVLHALQRRGLLVAERGGWRFAPISEVMMADVEALAAAYPRHLIPITHVIHAKPRAALRDFADAFRLREED